MLTDKEDQGMNTVMKTGLLSIAAVIVFGSAALAQEGNGALYKWTDKDGVVHVTDSLEKVPKDYRSKAVRIGEEGSGSSEASQAQSPAPPAPSDHDGGNDAALKAQWQSRMRDAKRRLQYAEEKFQQLAKQKSDLQAQWGSAGAALPPQSVLDEMKQLDADMANAKTEIDNARDMIDNVIPDEARRAGIPPGWLREVE